MYCFTFHSRKLNFTIPSGKEECKMKVLLWEMRTKKNCTLMQLAEKTGIGKSTLNNIENEKTSPNLFQLETIAIALDCRISDLYESEHK